MSQLSKRTFLNTVLMISFFLQKRPPDNSFYIRTCPKNPKKTRWWYHDDNV